MQEGYFRLWRKIEHSEIWNSPEPFDRRSAWVDIIKEARFSYQPKKVMIGNRVLTVNRGEVIYSYDTWARRWRWNKPATRRFLKMLEKLGYIRLVNETKTTRVIICNYDTYQSTCDEDETDFVTNVNQKRNERETKVAPTEEGNKDREGNKEKEGEKGAPAQVAAAPSIFGPLYDQFKSIHPECKKVARLQFDAALMAERNGVDLQTLAESAKCALNDFAVNCAAFTTFRPQGPVAKFRNYLRYALENEKKARREKPPAAGAGHSMLKYLKAAG